MEKEEEQEEVDGREERGGNKLIGRVKKEEKGKLSEKRKKEKEK